MGGCKGNVAIRKSLSGGDGRKNGESKLPVEADYQIM